ncbi:odorant receptor 94a-like [Anthonomus grandis grandis]|uniref:odorant receptor 94a-like n=1 Tax=Anthonomus grandis grandis TaxID=2921223 RepID=UPI0021654E7B|nr:odorant receptor 94a-like [Anthonomus grandis grandis]
MILAINPISLEGLMIVTYGVNMLSELGLYCWYGNMILFESSEIMISSYLSNWYERSRPVKKILFMLMERAKKPMRIKGGNYIALNYVTFVMIIKYSYSYFALLRSTMEED